MFDGRPIAYALVVQSRVQAGARFRCWLNSVWPVWLEKSSRAADAVMMLIAV